MGEIVSEVAEIQGAYDRGQIGAFGLDIVKRLSPVGKYSVADYMQHVLGLTMRGNYWECNDISSIEKAMFEASLLHDLSTDGLSYYSPRLLKSVLNAWDDIQADVLFGGIVLCGAILIDQAVVLHNIRVVNDRRRFSGETRKGLIRDFDGLKSVYNEAISRYELSIIPDELLASYARCCGIIEQRLAQVL